MDATDRQRDAEGGEGRGGGEEGGGGEETDIKSNNPHLTGGEPPRIPHPGWRQKIIHWGVGGCLPKFKMPVLELEYYIMISHPIHPPTLGSGPFTQHP